MTHTLKPAWLEWSETKKLTGIFAKHKVELRFVGGSVRDALLGKIADDIDAATPLAPEHVMDLLETEGVKAIPTGIDHGTVTAVIGKKTFEITTLRKDTSCDGRHAAVEYTEHWEEDARRRDFTINAFYLSPEGHLFDYFHGAHDLEQGIVRFIGKADDRVQEDFLRILRFFRFHARYAKGAPNAEALAACKKHAPQLAMLSGERIQQEMLKLLAAPAPSAALAAMAEIDLLNRIVPRAEIRNVKRLEQLEQKNNITPQAELRLAVLMAHAGEKEITTLAARLKLPRALAKFLQSALMHAEKMRSDMDISAQKKILRKLGTDIYVAAVLIAAVQAKDAAPYIAMLDLPYRWVPPEFPLSGADLKAKGIEEGKKLGDTLRALEEAWEESDFALSREQLLKKI